MPEEQTENRQAQPTEVQSKSNSDHRERALRSAIFGSSFIMWILAIFIIVSLNSIREELVEIRRSVDSNLADIGGLSGYQLVDKDGNAVYTLNWPGGAEYDVPTADAELENEAGPVPAQ